MRHSFLCIFALSLLISLNKNTEVKSQSKSTSDVGFEIAFMPDVHFHDVFADFNKKFEGLLTPFKSESRYATIRTMQSQLTSTRLFNENYFAFIAALEDAVKRGIKIIALPGDFSDDGQPIHVKGLTDILHHYQERYNLQFFITPGNHDPTRPFATEAGKGDYLGKSGQPQPIFSIHHPFCNSKTEDSRRSRQAPEPLDVICTDEVKEMGYSELFEFLTDFGLLPREQFVYYETPFSSYSETSNSTDQMFQKFGTENRQYEICREGSGGEYREADYTLCTNIMDMSYLVEPVEGLWLLAIDANVYIPQKESEDGKKVQFSGAGNTGYNNIITHKKHLLKWMKSIADRAKEKNKQLIAFSHYPVSDFYNGAKPLIENLWGENEFQLARMPNESARKIFTDTGIKLHIAGHMHMNGTSIHSDSSSANFTVNIQAPTLAAYVPAYKIVRVSSNTDIAEVETIVIDHVPNFDTLFPHYQEEWNYLNSIEYPAIWNKEILNSETYYEFTNWHIRELSRLRFLPREWPEDVRVLLQGLTGRDMLIASQLESSIPFSVYAQWIQSGGENIKTVRADFAKDWEQATKKAMQYARDAGIKLEDLNRWNGHDLSVDFYRLRNAGELALRDISELRITEYLLVAKSLAAGNLEISSNSETFVHIFNTKFNTVFEVISLFMDRLPNNNFTINLESGEIKELN